jgi:hypothetical protein
MPPPNAVPINYGSTEKNAPSNLQPRRPIEKTFAELFHAA